MATVAQTGAAEVGRGGTRARIIVLLRRHGELTASQLGELIGVTRVAVRRHLMLLEREGMVSATPRKPARGRPSAAYALTDAGLESFPRHYDELASQALVFLKGQDPAGLRAFLAWRNEQLAASYGARVHGTTPEERATSLAELLSDEGYMAEVEQTPDGLRLCQHNCTVEHLANDLPDLCTSETELFERVLGVPVEREATVVGGALRCVTRIGRDTTRQTRASTQPRSDA